PHVVGMLRWVPEEAHILLGLQPGDDRVSEGGTMVRLASGLLAIGIAIGCGALTGCGSDTPSATLNTSTARGTLIYDPPFRIASLNAADFGAQLSATIAGQ